MTPAPTKPAGGRLGGLLSSRGRVSVANVGKKRAPAVSLTFFFTLIFYAAFIRDLT